MINKKKELFIFVSDVVELAPAAEIGGPLLRSEAETSRSFCRQALRMLFGTFCICR